MNIPILFKKFFIPGIFFLTAFILPTTAFATVGVGVGLGKITIQKDFVPGGIYTLPSVPVLNTGDQVSRYKVDIEYLQTQQQIKPPQSWFLFSPNTFSLTPQHVQAVKPILTIPVNAKPGNYFAYIEAYPIKAASTGVTRINIAAATKLYFTVAPANIFQGMYYRVLSFITQNAPWTYIVFVLLGLAVLVALFRKYFSFNLGVSVKKKE